LNLRSDWQLQVSRSGVAEDRWPLVGPDSHRPHAALTGVRRRGVPQGRLPSRSTSGPGRLVPRTDFPRAPCPYPVPGERCRFFANHVAVSATPHAKNRTPRSTATHTGVGAVLHLVPSQCSNRVLLCARTGCRTPRGRLRPGRESASRLRHFDVAVVAHDDVALAGKRPQRGLPVASGPATSRQCLPGRRP
jgi:hypothetical protein